MKPPCMRCDLEVWGKRPAFASSRPGGSWLGSGSRYVFRLAWEKDQMQGSDSARGVTHHSILRFLDIALCRQVTVGCRWLRAVFTAVCSCDLRVDHGADEILGKLDR